MIDDARERVNLWVLRTREDIRIFDGQGYIYGLRMFTAFARVLKQCLLAHNVDLDSSSQGVPAPASAPAPAPAVVVVVAVIATAAVAAAVAGGGTAAAGLVIPAVGHAARVGLHSELDEVAWHARPRVPQHKGPAGLRCR